LNDRQPVIIGIGESDQLGIVPGKIALDHAVEASVNAMRDAGLDPSAIDGVYTTQGVSDYRHVAGASLAEYLGIAPVFTDFAPYGGVATAAVLGGAASAIVAGLANTILVASADTLRSGLGRRGAMTKIAENAHPVYEAPYWPTIISQYAMAARRHQYEFGTTDEHFAMVSVIEREHASRNPRAQMRQPITVEDVLQSPPIADPLRLLHCALISDGGSALIMTTAAQAKAWGVPNPIVVRGYSHIGTHLAISQAPSLTTGPSEAAGSKAMSMAGITPRDVDVFFPYDNFAPMVVIEMEDLGFCKKGQGGPFIAEQCRGLDGTLPFSTHGGLLSHAHPGRPLFSTTEAVRQLRGTAGDRQVRDARVAVVVGLSGVFSSAAVVVLTRD
jgi:acetyl-CoA acetyltransferase